MTTLRRIGVAVCFATTLAASGAALADTPAEDRERAEQMAREAMQRLMQALDMLIESIPQYEMPVINENGDIIIRRKRPPGPDAPKAPEQPDLDSTKT